MSYFFTTAFRKALKDNPAMMAGAVVTAHLLTSMPSLAFGSSAYIGAVNLADLTATPGWAEAAGTMPVQTVGTTTVAGNPNTYVVMPSARFPFTTAARAEGIAFTLSTPLPDFPAKANPIIFVSNTPIGDHQNIHPGDALTAIADPLVPIAGGGSYMFWWAPVPAGATNVNPIQGPLAMFKNAPAFEVSNTVHVWMYPQRVNMIANPSFEDIATAAGYWASNGALSVLSHPVGIGGHYMRTAGKVLQSNVWPTQKGEQDEPLWTFQMRLRGDGPTKVGLVYWDRDGRDTGVDWGGFYNEDGVLVPEVWTLNPTTWTHIAVNRIGSQAYQAMLRVETQAGTFIEIDEVLAEHGHLAGSQDQWGYFDGNTTYGARDDYFWYGGANRAGKSYSMYYGGRRAVVGRLFAAPTDSKTPINVLTDDELREAGMVYQWVPAGTSVVAHIGVLYPEDIVSDLVPQSATAILPYATPTTDGVDSPWV